jgi:hypothetical protein
MMKLWDRAEQSLAGLLDLAALGLALWLPDTVFGR